MKLAGAAELDRPPEEVFDLLLDPAVIGRCLPLAETLRELAPGVYEAHLRAGLGPLQGSFRGEFRVRDVARCTSYRLEVEGDTPIGRLRGDARLRLVATARGARLAYEGEVRIGGLFGALGGRALEAGAREMLERFFARLAAEVSRAERT